MAHLGVIKGCTIGRVAEGALAKKKNYTTNLDFLQGFPGEAAVFFFCTNTSFATDTYVLVTQGTLLI